MMALARGGGARVLFERRTKRKSLSRIDFVAHTRKVEKSAMNSPLSPTALINVDNNRNRCVCVRLQMYDGDNND